MFGTVSYRAAYGAGLGGVGRVDVFHPDSGRLRFVLDKALELRPGPPVQARAHAFSGFDPFAQVCQGLKDNHMGSAPYRFRDKRLADFVVDVGNVPGFSAGDFLQKLLRAFGAVALKSATKIQKAVAFVPEFSAAIQLPAAGGGKIVLSHVHAQGFSLGHGRGIREIEDKVEEPALALTHELGFFRDAAFKIRGLKGPGPERDMHASLKGKERQGVSTKTVRAFVEMDRRTGAELDKRPLFLSQLRSVGKERCIGLGDLMHGIAGHLGTQLRRGLSDRIVGGVVQFDSVRDLVLGRQGNSQTAGGGKRGLQPGKLLRLGRGYPQLQADRALDHR